MLANNEVDLRKCTRPTKGKNKFCRSVQRIMKIALVYLIMKKLAVSVPKQVMIVMLTKWLL